MPNEAVETCFVEAAGLRNRVLVAGEGQPLVLLHGAGPGMDAELNWAAIMPLLAARFRCYAIDLAGFGETSLPTVLPDGGEAWTTLRLRQIDAVLDALGVPTALFVGNSRGGGAIALRMLLDSPSRMQGAMLMGAAGYSAAEQAGSQSSREVLIRNFVSEPTIEHMAAIAPLFFHDVSALPMPLDDLIRYRFDMATRPDYAAAFLTMVKGGLPAAPAEHERFKAIDKPVMLVHGAEDRISDPANSLALQRRIPAASLHFLPHAGHWSHVDRPVAFAHLAGAFASGVFAPER